MESSNFPHQLINLTPHPVSLRTAAGVVVTIPPESEPARVTTRTAPLGSIRTRISNQTHSVLLVSERPDSVDGLPEPCPHVAYIVSRVVFDAAPDRNDLFCPTQFERNADGFIIAAGALAGRTRPSD
jgi:hypothetical protein